MRRLQESRTAYFTTWGEKLANVVLSAKKLTGLRCIQRYTSLGNTYNTFPNPHLSDDDAEAEKHIAAIASGKPSKGDEGRTARYRPAYLLADGGLERKGRVRITHRPE